MKLLSEDPAHYADAPIEGIRRVLEKITGRTFFRNEKLDVSAFQSLSVRMGTTVATNALLERKGAEVALLITEGFRDSLEIGLQSRPKLFDLNIIKADTLYQHVIEVEERVTIEGYQQSPSLEQDNAKIEEALKEDPNLVRGLGGQVVRVLKRLNESRVSTDLQRLYDQGCRSIAVCLAHSYTFQGL